MYYKAYINDDSDLVGLQLFVGVTGVPRVVEGGRGVDTRALHQGVVAAGVLETIPRAFSIFISSIFSDSHSALPLTNMKDKYRVNCFACAV